MLKIVSSVCAAAMMLTLPLTTPGFAMPVPAPAAAERNIVPAQFDYRTERNFGGDRRWRGGNRHDRPRYSRPGYERPGYYRGYRGYRHHRPGYRQHNGWWFPPAAFIAGAIIGGGMANQQPHRLSAAHVRWCQERWRSYRVSDNSYQPFNGPRRACVSPYS